MVDEGRRLEALDPALGTARWRRTLPAHHGMQLAGGTLLLTLLDGTVTGVDTATGDTRWSRRVPDQPMPTFVSFAGDPLAYATNLSADASITQVTAVDPATGALRWEARLRGNVTPVGVHDGSVFFLSTNEVYGDTDAVVRYTPKTRSTRRVRLPVARPDAQATVHGTTVYVLATSGALDAVDTETGKRLWNLETSVSRGSVPVADGRHVYFTTADGRLLAVGADDGRLVGQTPARLGSNSGTVAASLPHPVLADHHVYATAPDGTVFAVDARRPQDW
jgi:outer membrane protein assembly factor BamB